MYHWAKFHDSAINFYVRIFHLKFDKLIKETIEKQSLESQPTLHAPWERSCGLSPKETNQTRSPGVNQKLARKWQWILFQVQSIHCRGPKPEVLVTSRHIAMGKTKTVRTRTRSNNKKTSKKSNTTDQVAPEAAKETMLTEMREAGYVINISYIIDVVSFAFFITANVFQKPFA